MSPMNRYIPPLRSILVLNVNILPPILRLI